MSNYRYATILEAQNDGMPPNDNVEAGDISLKAGKHDGDSISYITDDKEMHTIEWKTVAQYELPRAMGEREAMEFAAEQYRGDSDE